VIILAISCLNTSLRSKYSRKCSDKSNNPVILIHNLIDKLNDLFHHQYESNITGNMGCNLDLNMLLLERVPILNDGDCDP
jgi:hypothetical protein